MTSDLVPVAPVAPPSKAKDILIAILSLGLCFSLTALIFQTHQQQADQRKIADQTAQIDSQAQALARADQNRVQAERALRRTQISLKAATEAHDIVAKLARSR